MMSWCWRRTFTGAMYLALQCFRKRLSFKMDGVRSKCRMRRQETKSFLLGQVQLWRESSVVSSEQCSDPLGPGQGSGGSRGEGRYIISAYESCHHSWPSLLFPWSGTSWTLCVVGGIRSGALLTNILVDEIGSLPRATTLSVPVVGCGTVSGITDGEGSGWGGMRCLELLV